MQPRVVLKPTRIPSRNPREGVRPPSRPPSHIPIEPQHRPKKKRRKGRLLKGIFITIGGMAMTALVIRASDTWIPTAKELVGGVGNSSSVQTARCPSDMTFVSDSGGGFCIDKYEASAGKSCPHVDPANQFETNDNISQPLCLPMSQSDASPWVNIPESQALEMCSRVGKHLASNAEWYRAALGTPDTFSESALSTGCVLGRVGVSHGEKTGIHSACVSSPGAFDMVGNVWEWVDGNIVDGTYQKRDLPSEGFVSEADVDGVPVKTASSSNEVFHGDYFYLNREGVSGMIRGGFWNLTDKAGVATINATVPMSFVGSAVGFRCAK